jgi:hypothetical protein
MLKEPTTAPPEIQQRLQQHQALQTRVRTLFYCIYC